MSSSSPHTKQKLNIARIRTLYGAETARIRRDQLPRPDISQDDSFQCLSTCASSPRYKTRDPRLRRHEPPDESDEQRGAETALSPRPSTPGHLETSQTETGAAKRGSKEATACRDSAPSGMTSPPIPRRAARPIRAPPAICLTKANTTPGRPKSHGMTPLGPSPPTCSLSRPIAPLERLNPPPLWGVDDVRHAELLFDTGRRLGYTSWFSLGPEHRTCFSSRLVGIR